MTTLSLTDLLSLLQRLHAHIRSAVVNACENAALETIAQVADDSDEGDTIYAIDRVSEETLLEFFSCNIAPNIPLRLIAEGLPGGSIILPEGTPPSSVRWCIIMDPIDGTRGLMYQKRSGWILTGVAPNRGPDTNLQDIVLALQTEIPLLKQHLSDMVWAIRGQGVQAQRYNRITGQSRALYLRPSTAPTIAHGFAMVSRFFPGARQELAAIDEEIVEAILGPVQPGKAHCFEDQYISSGGQLYEVMAGHDRFIADLRPLMEPLLAKRGLALGICCHPYDVCTELIARELGVIVTDTEGQLLRAVLDTSTDVAWVCYANARIRAQVEPVLQQTLKTRGFV